VPLAVDQGFARLALRLQRIEFLLKPLLEGFAGIVRTANSLRDRRSVTSSLTGPGADAGSGALGQAKEARARPMRPGDPFGDYCQRAITLALIFEPFLSNQDDVSAPPPLTH